MDNVKAREVPKDREGEELLEIWRANKEKPKGRQRQKQQPQPQRQPQ